MKKLPKKAIFFKKVLTGQCDCGIIITERERRIKQWKQQREKNCSQE